MNIINKTIWNKMNTTIYNPVELTIKRQIERDIRFYIRDKLYSVLNPLWTQLDSGNALSDII